MSQTNQVLVVLKPDATTHIVPIANMPYLKAYNNKLPMGQKWEIKTMTAEEAAALPFINPNHVTGAAAVVRAQDLQNENEKLRRQLAELQGTGGGSKAPEAVAVVIQKIKEATTAEEVGTIAGADNRQAVTKAANKRIAELQGK